MNKLRKFEDYNYDDPEMETGNWPKVDNNKPKKRFEVVKKTGHLSNRIEISIYDNNIDTFVCEFKPSLNSVEYSEDMANTICDLLNNKEESD